MQQYRSVVVALPADDPDESQQGNNSTIKPPPPPHDTVSVSKEGRALSNNSENPDIQNDKSVNKDNSVNNENSSSSQSEDLTASDKAALTKLQARDKQVRAHEQAHLAAAGQYARGGAAFVYKTGPDGKIYAVGGEVSIDIGKENNPEATVTKMQIVRRAALAPAQPSSTDRQVASQATARLNQAQQQIQQERMSGIQMNMKADSADDDSNEMSENSGALSSTSATNNTRKLMVEAYKAVNEYL